MRTYICTRCGESITVGHPEALFKRQALSLARETSSWLGRLVRRGHTVGRLVDALVARHYAQPHRYRELPPACPHCASRGQADLPWWRPGPSYRP